MRLKRFITIPVAGLLITSLAWAAEGPGSDGFIPLFNGKDLAGWKVPDGDNGHWKVVDGVIDYDAASEAKGDKTLWSEREYGDFVLQLDWRLKEAPFINKNIPYILPDGTHARDIHGKELKFALPDADSGVFLRGDGDLPGQHLVLADRLGRDVQRPDRPQDSPDLRRGRHPEASGRQARRRVESLRDHGDRQDGQGRC